MRVRATRNSFKGCPDILRRVGFSDESQIKLTLDRDYSVWAISKWKRVVFFLVIDDIKYPVWLPAWLFELMDREIPPGWIFSAFDDEVEIIVGPEFIAKDEQSYGRMVELHPSAVEAFWRYVKDMEM